MGEPLSVQVVGPSFWREGSMSIFIRNESGGFLFNVRKYPTKDLSDAAALVMAEMNDGDNEYLTLRGYRVPTSRFTEQRYTLTSVYANGYEVVLK